jgi:hypothetical protein
MTGLITGRPDQCYLTLTAKSEREKGRDMSHYEEDDNV